MTRFLCASALLSLLLLASCGGAAGVLQPRAVLDDPPADENPEGWHITYSRLPWRVGGSCTLKGDYPGDPGYDVVLGEHSWAVFALDPPPGKRVAAVQVLSQPPAEGAPAGVFWVGLEDKGGGRWDLYGPFAGQERKNSRNLPSGGSIYLPVIAEQHRSERFTRLISEPVYQSAWRYALRLCANREDAEDLLQESLSHAYAKLDQLKSEETVRGWVLSIIRSKFLRHRQRAKSRQQTMDMELAEYALAGGASSAPASVTTWTAAPASCC